MFLFCKAAFLEIAHLARRWYRLVSKYIASKSNMSRRWLCLILLLYFVALFLALKLLNIRVKANRLFEELYALQ